MRTKYEIYRLPKNSICPDEDKSERHQEMYKIKENTFPGVSEKLRIRPRAAWFANRLLGGPESLPQPIYAILLKKENAPTKCLAFYGVVGNGKYLCRCVGKHGICSKREEILNFISGHYDILELLPRNVALVFFENEYIK